MHKQVSRARSSRKCQLITLKDLKLGIEKNDLSVAAPVVIPEFSAGVLDTTIIPSKQALR